MSATDAATLGCLQCGLDNPVTNRFCGSCGTPLVELAPSGRAMAAPPSRRPIPKKTLVTGLALLVIGGVAATAVFAVIQAQGAATYTRDFGAPAVNAVLRHFGVDAVEAPEGGTAPSLAMILAFFTFAVMAAAGLFISTIAGLVSLVRSRPQDKVAAARAHAQPSVDRARARAHDAAQVAGPAISNAATRTRRGVRHTVQRGRQTWDAEAAPRLSRAGDTAKHGWGAAAPAAADAARRGVDRLRGSDREPPDLPPPRPLAPDARPLLPDPPPPPAELRPPRPPLPD